MSRDVELIIKAKDAASAAINDIKSALKELTGAQDSVGKSAEKTDSLLSKLGQELANLKRDASNLTSFGRIASELDKTEAAVTRLESGLRDSADAFAKVARDRAEAEKGVNRLRGTLEAEEKALKQNSAAFRESRKELTEANRLLQQAQRNQDRYNKSIQATPEVKRSPAVASAGTFIAADLDAARVQQERLAADVARLKNEVNGSKTAIAALKPEIAAAASNERTLSLETEKAVGSLDRQRESLTKARTGLAEVKGAAGEASKALGGMAVDQDKVAAAASRTAAELARTKARIDALAKTPQTTAPTTPDTTRTFTEQRRQLLELKRDWVEAQAEVKRLAVAMRDAEQPTIELGTAFGQAQARARQAKEAYAQQQAALAQLAAAGRSSFSTFNQSAASAGGALRAIKPAADGAGAAMGGAATGANGLRSALSGVYGESRKSLSLLQRLRGEVLSLTASYVGLYAAGNQIGGVINSFKTLEAAQSRLGAVFNQDTSKVSQELDFLHREADRLGISFGTLADEYGKFVIAADAANFSAGATRKIFLSVAEAGRVNKLSIDQMQGVFLALTQMISKGKVSSEELRRQLGDRLPGAFNIFADAIGVSTAQLDKMMRQGEVLANQSTLVAFADQLDKRFGSQLPAALRTVTTEIDRFQNNLFEAQLQVAQGGFIDGLKNGLIELNSFFRSREGHDFFLSLGSALGKFVSVLGQVPKYFDEIKVAIEAFVAFKLAGIFNSLIVSLRTTQGSLSGAAASFFTWNGNLKAAENAIIRFSASARPVGAVLAGLRAQLLGAATAGGIAGARFVAMQAGLSALRALAGLVAGSFRLLWTAIGGLPGLILTGISFALGSWLTQVDDTTAAIDEHKRIMGEVIAAYEKVKGTAKDWGQEVRNVTLDQAIANLRKMGEVLDENRQKLKAINASDFFSFNGLQRANPGDAAIAVQLRDLKKEVDGGKLSLADFVDQVDVLYRKINDDTLKQWAETLLASGRAARDSEKDLGNAALTAQKLGDASKETGDIVKQTGASIEKLADQTDDAADSLSKAADKAKQFDDILTQMKKLIPDVGKELKNLGEIDALEKQYQAAAKLATTMSQINGLNEQYAASLNGIIDKTFNANSNIVNTIAGIESGGSASAKNPNSSATGLGQFIESTWLRMFKQYFPDRAQSLTDAAILELRKNETVSRQMIALYVQENAKILQKAGVAVTDANLYLAHFLGPGGATKLLKAPAGTKTQDVLGPAQIQANQSILGGKTVDQVIAWAQRKVGLSQEEVAVNKELAEIDNKRAQKAKDYNTDLEARLATMADEVANDGQLSREGFVQKALAAEMKRAREAEVTLTDQQIAKIKELAGKEYDIKQARREGKADIQEANAALQQAVALSQQRAVLQQQFNQAQKSGDASKATSLDGQIQSVNTQLQEAIDKAIAMWQAIGGPQADVALTKLDTLKIKASSAANGLSFLGLSTQQIGQLANSFADGFVGMFDTFFQGLDEGKSKTEALRDAFLKFAADFLRQIAQMIIKQAILNALQSLGIPGLGGGGGGLLSSLFHSGSTSVGSTSAQTRSVSPALFANAVRYHQGVGSVGLKPGEMPAILKRGEIVDPGDGSIFAKMFGGGDGGKAGGATNVYNLFDAASYLSEALKSKVGEKALLNFVSANPAAFKAALAGNG
ncbi:tape measure protein [Mesorhizobium sp. B2-8-9]|uniref:tape measure protein n=1 Tax=Mesorhizobium sp. B2-8-9 TaxID=2589899 RepID=UPI001127C209|nr:tape measure protein [Mesorhizobium sp. B2-8-9]TPI86364.1 tape measure protein [Mesorhizobium sp. B2-8-9]